MKTRVYYNEISPEKCEWLRQLMKMGLIPEGEIDERSIVEVQPGDLAGYKQCHFFAGVAGWPLSLQHAGVPDLECWTGSCPCQPFSPAGKKLGTEDERHLWPIWFRLIRECRPQLVLGEQVEEAIAYGWLDLVSSDLETEGYACGAIVLGAHSVGSPHIRQRLYWVADAEGPRIGRDAGVVEAEERGEGIAVQHVSGRGGPDCELAESGSERERHEPRGMGTAERQAEGGEPQTGDEAEDAEHGGTACALGDSQHHGLHGIPGLGGKENEGRLLEPERPSHDAGGLADANRGRYPRAKEGGGEGAAEHAVRAGGAGAGFWADARWLYCPGDGKWRPTKPGIYPLVAGLSRNVGRGCDPGAPLDANATAEARDMRISGYGNAIVPEVAAEFIRAYMESLGPWSNKKQ